MISPVKTQLNLSNEQYFILPGYYNWQQFKTFEAAIEKSPGIRIFYLDGCIEIMTLGEQHEAISRMIATLLSLYFLHNQIEFIPVGSATRESEDKNVSFQPDESYYIGEQKEHPDLAVEVVISSGNTSKLEKYKRLNITEVWFWENNQLSIYSLKDGNYEAYSQSQLLPSLDINLLVNCVQMSSKLEAMTAFSQGISGE
ncbi:MAG: Uma2 family endonuclease [Microcoleaceae cyanobacterium]